jgi:hypothetical protein
MKSSESKVGRRDFLKTIGLAAPLIVTAAGAGADERKGPAPAAARSRRPKELSADLVIIGGGLGGCAAALEAVRHGLNVIVTEETDWIGGQITQQAVPPDENQWIESFGGTRAYQHFRQGIREFYFRNYPLTDAARADKYFNPGRCWVSRLGCEPRVALAVLYEMLAPFLGNGQARILLRHKAIRAAHQADLV